MTPRISARPARWGTRGRYGLPTQALELFPIMATLLALAAAAASLTAPLRARGAAPKMLAASDLLRLGDISQTLASNLNIVSTEPNEQASIILDIHSSGIASLTPKIYEAQISTEERVSAIQDLAVSLDELEAVAVGPMLTGKQLSLADAACFPSFALFEQTLPQFFGWEEWTEEAIWWKRPRLHAWYELMGYERAAREAQRTIEAGIAGVDMTALSVDVPTSRLRKKRN